MRTAREKAFLGSPSVFSSGLGEQVHPRCVYILLQLIFASLPRASGAISGRSPAITPFVICSSVISRGTLSLTREVDCCVLDASILHLPYLSMIISCPSWRNWITPRAFCTFQSPVAVRTSCSTANYWGSSGFGIILARNWPKSILLMWRVTIAGSHERRKKVRDVLHWMACREGGVGSANPSLTTALHLWLPLGFPLGGARPPSWRSVPFGSVLWTSSYSLDAANPPIMPSMRQSAPATRLAVLTHSECKHTRWFTLSLTMAAWPPSMSTRSPPSFARIARTFWCGEFLNSSSSGEPSAISGEPQPEAPASLLSLVFWNELPKNHHSHRLELTSVLRR